MTAIRLAAITLLVASFAAAPAALLADEILDWNQLALETMRTEHVSPPRVAYNLALMHVAMYDAVNAVTGNYTSVISSINLGAGEISQQAAAISAAHSTLSSIFPTYAPVFDQQLATNLAALPANEATARGLLLGQTAAAATIEWRFDDGYDHPSTYLPTDGPGRWRPTPPGYSDALDPHFGNVRPFAADAVEHFMPPPPPALDSTEYAADWQQVRDIGGSVSAIRTDDQTEIATFWNDIPGPTATPPGKWNLIAQTLGQQQGNSLEENARMFALLNMAMADAGIASWNAKYYYDLWRPEDAIRLADLDGNPLTASDPDWTPLWPSPPFPGYTSGHSSFSGAGSQVLILFFGEDEIAFEIPAGWDVLPGVTRSFDSLTQAAEEAGMSRIYGGIHFMFDNTAGLDVGRSIAYYTFDNYGRVIPEPLTISAWLAGLGTLLACRRLRRRCR